MAARRNARGFTLIELLIAIAVVGILTALAVASYDFAMVKARRGAAKACLTEGAQALERRYTLTFSYEGATLPGCSDDVTDHYVVGVAASGPPGSTVRNGGVPPGAPAATDSPGGPRSIDNTGVRSAGDGSAAAVDACW